MLMLDRIVNINDTGGQFGKGEIVAEFDIKPDLWFFDCHFKGDPVMPGCLPLDALWQALGFFLGWMKAPGPIAPPSFRSSCRKIPSACAFAHRLTSSAAACAP